VRSAEMQDGHSLKTPSTAIRMATGPRQLRSCRRQRRAGSSGSPGVAPGTSRAQLSGTPAQSGKAIKADRIEF